NRGQIDEVAGHRRRARLPVRAQQRAARDEHAVRTERRFQPARLGRVAGPPDFRSASGNLLFHGHTASPPVLALTDLPLQPDAGPVTDAARGYTARRAIPAIRTA